MKCNYCGENGKRKEGFKTLTYCEKCWWEIQDCEWLGRLVIKMIVEGKQPNWNELKEIAQSQKDFNKRWDNAEFLIKEMQKGKNFYEARKLLKLKEEVKQNDS